MSLTFEWDERKNQRNIARHGIDFADAAKMFDLPLLVLPNDVNEQGEQRWTGIGWLRTQLCVVIFTEPESDRIRIISVRKATKREMKLYGEIIRH